MIKVSVLYPNTPGSTFDMDYYCEKHMPMVHEKMAGACVRYSVERGLAGGRPGEPAAYAAIGQMFFDSLPAFQNAFGPHAKAINADIPNYTDVVPVIQISEVVVG
ncbi:MAG: EthD family reductase [Pseudomonadota bacterium]